MDLNEMAVYTQGWSPGKRANLLHEVAQDCGCDDLMPWDKLLSSDFFTAPASTKYHGAYEGGLFDHSLSVANVLWSLTKHGVTSRWGRSASPFLVGIFHDLTKLSKYMRNDTEDGYKWSPAQDLPIYGGHGAESALRAHRWVPLTDEESLCIRFHMGAYEHDDWDAYDIAIKQYPNVLWTHTADMLVSKLIDK